MVREYVATIIFIFIIMPSPVTSGSNPTPISVALKDEKSNASFPPSCLYKRRSISQSESHPEINQLNYSKMAELFIKQAQVYADNRPTYPPDLFRFIASTTPQHDVVWDVGTGSGQAIKALAEIYKEAIGTDTSEKQLEHAPKIANVRYQKTPAAMSIADLESHVAKESTVDLVTIAQAIHWLDLENFYAQVRHVLKKPDGVIAAWCYTCPEVDSAVDVVFNNFYKVISGPFWEKERKIVDDKYKSIEFPFEAVEGVEGTGPVEFTAEKRMSLEGFLSYLRSWSAYNTAKERGVELLGEEVVADFKAAWEEDGGGDKVVRFPVYLRIGKVGNST